MRQKTHFFQHKKIVKTVITLFFLASGLSSIKATPDFTQVQTLPEFTNAFLAQPEYVGKFTNDQKNKLFLGQAGNLNTVLRQEIQEFSQHFTDKNSTKNKSYFDSDNWHKKIPYGTVYAKPEHYVQKISVKQNTIICFIGDLHGSIHTFIRNIWRLVALGYLDEKLIIKKPDFHIVFLGDYINYGRWSAEVLTLPLKFFGLFVFGLMLNPLLSIFLTVVPLRRRCNSRKGSNKAALRADHCSRWILRGISRLPRLSTQESKCWPITTMSTLLVP